MSPESGLNRSYERRREFVFVNGNIFGRRASALEWPESKGHSAGGHETPIVDDNKGEGDFGVAPALEKECGCSTEGKNEKGRSVICVLFCLATLDRCTHLVMPGQLRAFTSPHPNDAGLSYDWTLCGQEDKL